MTMHRADLGRDQYIGFDSENPTEPLAATDLVVALQTIIQRFGPDAMVMIRHDPRQTEFGAIRNCVSVFATTSEENGVGVPIVVLGDMCLTDD